MNFDAWPHSPFEIPNPWEEVVQGYEKLDKTAPPAPGQTVFVGSSSIGFWPDLEHDFLPLPTFRRGYGGSQMVDSLYFAPRVILPYRPRAVVVYAGDNDIACGKTPEQVRDDLAALVGVVRSRLPECWFYVISVKPSPSRESMWLAFRRTNAAMKAFAEATKRTRFVNVWDAMLAADGRGCPELFTPDMLHMNPDGYALWVSILKPVLLADWSPAAA